MYGKSCEVNRDLIDDEDEEQATRSEFLDVLNGGVLTFFTFIDVYILFILVKFSMRKHKSGVDNTSQALCFF